MRFSNSDCCSCVAPPEWAELRCRTYPLLFLRGTSGVGGAELPYSTYPLLFLRSTSGVGGAEICPTPPPWLNLDFMAGDSFRLKLSLSRKLKKEPLWARNTVKKGNTTVWESTTVRKDHCAKGPLCERTIVWKDHCAKGPLCERTIVRKDHCVKGPLCERTIVRKDHCVKGTLGERNTMWKDRCLKLKVFSCLARQIFWNEWPSLGNFIYCISVFLSKDAHWKLLILYAVYWAGKS